MSSPSHIELPAELGIPEAETLKIQLLDALDLGAPFALAAGSVRRVGTAGLQVLLALSLELQRRGQPLVWANASDALIAAAASIGVSEALSLTPIQTS